MIDLFNNNSIIEANEIIIGNNFKIGENVDIKVRGTFKIGDNGTIGDRFYARAENITIGDYFFNVPTDSRGMNIGGGSSGFPFAELTIGDGMVCHTGHINLARRVDIGNNVGLSHDVDIITHGFWNSVLDGHPKLFAPVLIGDNVIVGWKTIIMSGIITNDVVIGAHSTVIGSLLESHTIYAGTPAKKIKKIVPLKKQEREKLAKGIVDEFNELLTYYDVPEYSIGMEFPFIYLNELSMNIEDKICFGVHDDITDAFRDVIRRSGIRIFDPRGFRFNLKRK